jgi:hypothetical protein
LLFDLSQVRAFTCRKSSRRQRQVDPADFRYLGGSSSLVIGATFPWETSRVELLFQTRERLLLGPNFHFSLTSHFTLRRSAGHLFNALSGAIPLLSSSSPTLFHPITLIPLHPHHILCPYVLRNGPRQLRKAVSGFEPPQPRQKG